MSQASPPSIPSLRLHLLGEFHLASADHSVAAVNTPRLQSLLAYLVLHHDTPQSRQQLAARLWPDSPEAQAHANLRNLIHQLRLAIPGAERYLRVDRHTVQWQAAAPFWCDVAEFEQSLSAGAMEQALALYQGDLLPSCYDEWITPKRERLRQQMLGALERLSQAAENVRDYRTAIDHAHRWAQAEPLREDIYRRLMRLHAQCDDYPGILRVYANCAAILQRELGIAPSAETRAAYHACLRPRAAASSEAPPLCRTNLPCPLTSFIGRAGEKNDIQQLLCKDHRLVTLTGTGGVGKTRLTLAVAAELLDAFADGVWHVELAVVADPRLVPQAVGMALEAREEPGRPLSATLADHLRDKTALLVWDNCEHVIEACAQLARYLLQRCPGVRILTSSREALGVEGEAAYHVPSLSLPPEETPGPEVLQQSEAVRLFVERAREVLPDFRLTEANAPAVVQVCRRVDGVALALELAAARVKLLKVEQIAGRLDDAFRLLTGGSRTALPRQQTLRATLDWSHHLLSETERVFLRRLAVFVGSWTLEAAEGVCAGERVEAPAVLDLLAQLVNKSLVVLERKPGHAARYSLLETVRQYAREKWLAAGEAERVRRQHLAFFLKLAQEAEPKLYAARQLEGLAQLDAEQRNLRAALEYAVTGGTEAGLTLAGALFWYWHLRIYWIDGYAWLQKALAAAPGTARSLRARRLSEAGHLARLAGDFKQAVTYSEESIALFREAGDQAGQAFPLATLGLMVSYQDLARGKALLEESLRLYREAGDKWGSRHVFGSLGEILRRQGQFGQAGACFQESLTLARELGVPDGIAWALNCLGTTAFAQGDYECAMACYTEGLPISRAIKQTSLLAAALFYLVRAALHLGRLEQAKAFAREALELRRETGPTISWRIFRFEAGRPGVVAPTLKYLALAEKSGDRPTIAVELFIVAHQVWGMGQLEKAVRLYAAASASASILTHFTPLERADFDHILTGTLLQLDEATFKKAWAEGSAMTVEQAVAYARQPAS